MAEISVDGSELSGQLPEFSSGRLLCNHLVYISLSGNADNDIFDWSRE